MISFLSVPLGAAYHVVLALASFLSPLGPGLATAAAIVAFTIGVRLLLSPLSFYAFRGQARLARLQPQVASLRRRFGQQPDRLQAELTALYRAEAGGLLGGCLPLLLQLPFFSLMYRIFLSRTVAGAPNTLLSAQLLGTPLGSSLLAAGLLSPHGLVFAALLAALATAAYLSARLGRRMAAATGTAATSTAATAGPAWLTGLLPYTTVVIAAFVPLAAGLYLLTTTCWTLAERMVIARLHGRAEQLAAVPTAADDLPARTVPAPAGPALAVPAVSAPAGPAPTTPAPASAFRPAVRRQVVRRSRADRRRSGSDRRMRG